MGPLGAGLGVGLTRQQQDEPGQGEAGDVGGELAVGRQDPGRVEGGGVARPGFEIDPRCTLPEHSASCWKVRHGTRSAVAGWPMRWVGCGDRGGRPTGRSALGGGALEGAGVAGLGELRVAPRVDLADEGADVLPRLGVPALGLADDGEVLADVDEGRAGARVEGLDQLPVGIGEGQELLGPGPEEGAGVLLVGGDVQATRQSAPWKLASTRAAVSRIQALSWVYGSSTTVSSWKVVSHSSMVRLSPPRAVSFTSSFTRVTTAEKVVPDRPAPESRRVARPAGPTGSFGPGTDPGGTPDAGIVTVDTFGYKLMLLLHLVSIVVAFAPAFVCRACGASCAAEGDGRRPGARRRRGPATTCWCTGRRWCWPACSGSAWWA